jgi:hypothetical protein
LIFRIHDKPNQALVKVVMVLASRYVCPPAHSHTFPFEYKRKE